MILIEGLLLFSDRFSLHIDANVSCYYILSFFSLLHFFCGALAQSGDVSKETEGKISSRACIE